MTKDYETQKAALAREEFSNLVNGCSSPLRQLSGAYQDKVMGTYDRLTAEIKRLNEEADELDRQVKHKDRVIDELSTYLEDLAFDGFDNDPTNPGGKGCNAGYWRKRAESQVAQEGDVK